MKGRTREELLSELRRITDRAASASAGEGARAQRSGARTAGLLASGIPAGDGLGPVKLVVGVEDSVYFHWQLAVLFESLVGQMPDDWEPIVVVCNDHAPISEILTLIFDVYDVRYFTGAHHPSAVDIDFAAGSDYYAPFNKIEALRAIEDRVGEDDRICLIDTDNFLYGDLDIAVFPAGDAVCETWLLARDPFTHPRDPARVDLPKLLQSLGHDGDYARGGVAVFLSGATVRNPKFVRDCFRFTQVVYLMGAINGLDRFWMAEMPCYSLALAANGIDTELLSADAFVIDNRAEVEPGSFYHYYVDFGDGGGEGAFHASPWCKQGYRKRNLLEDDGHLVDLEEASVTRQERTFFRLARRARQRLTS